MCLVIYRYERNTSIFRAQYNLFFYFIVQWLMALSWVSHLVALKCWTSLGWTF